MKRKSGTGVPRTGDIRDNLDRPIGDTADGARLLLSPDLNAIAPLHKSFLFSNHRIADAESGSSDFGHTFGGPHDRTGGTRDCTGGILLHLLHRFSLRDPNVPIAIPGLTWLPLYYVFDFRANDLGYRLTSDNSMVTYFPQDDPNVSESEQWPTNDYASEFPQSSISVSPRPYDPTVLDDAYNWAGVFGIGQLSADDQAAARTRVDELMEAYGMYPPETDEDYEACLSSPFAQAKPSSNCLNPDCENHHFHGKLQVIALVVAEPVPDVSLWGGGQVQILFELCPSCYAIRSSNQCT